MALGVLAAALCLAGLAAPADEEQELIQVLQSERSPREKDAACARLKRIGTARAVPALAALLADEQLSHSARYALESMPWPEAGQALREAPGKTTGLTKVGIINSLAVRGDTQAVPALAKLVAEPARGASAGPADAGLAVTTAAAAALGQIGGPAALSTLDTALGNSTGPAKDAVIDALLRCANRLLASGDHAQALSVFQGIDQTRTKDFVRIAAYRGLILASGKNALGLMTEAIVSKDAPSRTAALQLVREVDAPGATEAFAKLLATVGPAVQVALIGGLAQRGDPAAAPAIASLAASAGVSPAAAATAEVRLAALNALGLLGDASAVPLLTQAAATGGSAEQAAARESLVRLRRGDVTAMLLTQLATAKPAEQAEAARALGARGDTAAVPKLLDLAQQEPDSARKAALQALGLLVDEPQLGPLVNLVLTAKADLPRAEAVEALNAACQRLQSRRGHFKLDPLVQGLATGPTEGRIALLPVCSQLVDPQVRSAFRAAVVDSDARVRAAATRALCDTTDAELLPDLVKVASTAPEENVRALAVGGCVRLTAQEETKLSNAQRVETLKALLATPLQPGQKRVVLAGLAGIPDLQALMLVEPLLAEPAVQTEAARAASQIATALPPSQSQAAAAVLRKALAATTDGPTRQAARAALNKLEADADFITAWQVTGPYRQEGQNFTALFDIAFPLETGSPQDVKWQTLPAGADPKRPWVMDLLKALGGEQCVAYARTWVHAEQPQTARLEIGSDDGVKVWLNGKVVHANNTSRALKPGADKVNVTLNSGWNLLLLKVTQNNQGWAFCARFLSPDGAHLEGVRFDANHSQ